MAKDTIQDRLEAARLKAGSPSWTEITRQVQLLLPRRLWQHQASIERFVRMRKADDKLDKLALLGALAHVYGVSLEELSPQLAADAKQVADLLLVQCGSTARSLATLVRKTATLAVSA